MTDINQLQERLRKVITEIRRKPYPIADLIPLLSEAADALQARAQVQGEPVAIYSGHRLTPEGTKEFWGYADKPLQPGTKLYTTPQPAQATQPAEVTDAAIDAATRHLYHNGKPTSKEYRVSIARAILALRPAAVPMTDARVDSFLFEIDTMAVRHGRDRSLPVGNLEFLEAARALTRNKFGITAQAKKEGV